MTFPTMDKALLQQQLVVALETVHQGAIDAAMLAYNTAIDEENVAENRYDTLGLEAAYLAQGQAQRVTACEAELRAFRAMPLLHFAPSEPVAVGALITLQQEGADEQYLFLGPAAGGLKLQFGGKPIMVITLSAPLGQALLGGVAGDEVAVSVAGTARHYEIVAVC
jgi:transcription elongation GreA/GreB family factor